MRHAHTVAASGCAIFLATLGCSNEEAPKAWNALSTCLAGSAAQADLPKRIKQIRLIQLSSTDPSAGKDAWPGRCSQHANELYASISSSGETAILKRKLQERLNCAEDKASCAVVNSEALISMTTELWEAAKGAGFTAQPAANVTAPKPLAEPLVNAENWKSLADKPHGAVGPRLKPDGGALVLLRGAEEKGRPTWCEFSPGFDKVKCTPASAEMPEVPLRTVEFARSPSGAHVAALTETGLVAYNLTNGEKSEVRGTGGGLVQDGVAVEGGGTDDGLLAVVLKNGKASKETKLPVKIPRNKPIVVGDQIVWLEQLENGVEFIAKSMTGGGLKDTAALKGAFSGPFHTCESDGRLAVATWERNASQPGAKPTAGEGKTQLAITQFQGGAWSKPAELVLPFERLAESELHCTKTGASMVYAARVDGALQINRVDCGSDACKTSSVKLSNVESKWWWSVAPMGDKTFIMWRSSLGETRLRVAALGELDKSPDVLVFDTPDFGGPSAPDASSLISNDGALFVFKSERPVALSVAPSGAVKVVAKQ